MLEQDIIISNKLGLHARVRQGEPRDRSLWARGSERAGHFAHAKLSCDAHVSGGRLWQVHRPQMSGRDVPHVDDLKVKIGDAGHFGEQELG